MKTLKTLDLHGSIVLIVASICYAMLWQDSTFIYGYFAVGGWQCVSMIVHIGKGWFVQAGARRTYHCLVVAVLGTVVMGVVFESILYIGLYLLLYAAPFMAIYYAAICHRELFVKMQRPLAQLK